MNGTTATYEDQYDVQHSKLSDTTRRCGSTQSASKWYDNDSSVPKSWVGLVQVEGSFLVCCSVFCPSCFLVLCLRGPVRCFAAGGLLALRVCHVSLLKVCLSRCSYPNDPLLSTSRWRQESPAPVVEVKTTEWFTCMGGAARCPMCGVCIGVVPWAQWQDRLLRAVYKYWVTFHKSRNRLWRWY